MDFKSPSMRRAVILYDVVILKRLLGRQTEAKKLKCHHCLCHYTALNNDYAFCNGS